MKKYLYLFVPLMATLSFQVQAGSGLDSLQLEELSESSLQDVSGQAGVAVDLEYRINVDASGNPVSCGTLDCRMALGIADRAGGWLVMKDYRSIIKLSGVYVDVSTLSTTNTLNRDLTAMNLGGGSFDPNGKPAIQLTIGEWGQAWKTGGAALNTYLSKNEYKDFQFYSHIGAITAEFDSTASVGFLRNANGGAALSLRMGDASAANAAAKMRLDGRLQLFGY